MPPNVLLVAVAVRNEGDSASLIPVAARGDEDKDCRGEEQDYSRLRHSAPTSR